MLNFQIKLRIFCDKTCIQMTERSGSGQTMGSTSITMLQRQTMLVNLFDIAIQKSCITFLCKYSILERNPESNKLLNVSQPFTGVNLAVNFVYLPKFQIAIELLCRVTFTLEFK